MKLTILLLVAVSCMPGRQSAAADGGSAVQGRSYILGPGDQITVRALEIEEINEKAVRIDTGGGVRLPLAGRIQAGGLSIEQFESALVERLKTYAVRPDLSVTVSEYRSQPVSVIGAVRNPGVYQVQGSKTLVEMLSSAGGLDTSAGNKIKIARRRAQGDIPLESAKPDSTGEFSVAEVSLKSILNANNPRENIYVQPQDVISIPRSELVYVVGQVQKPGGFVLNENESISALTALSLAGGLDRTAKAQKSRILRRNPGSKDKTEIPIDLKRILDGRSADVQLQAEDILFVPNSTPQRVALRAVEAAIQTGTGVVIWRR